MFCDNIPNWIVKNLQGKLCEKCHNTINGKDIIAIGLRQHQDKATPFIEYVCSKCSYRAARAFSGHQMDTVEHLCYSILEEIKHKQKSSKSETISSKCSKLPISDKEIKSFVKKLKTYKSHMQFMRQIGAISHHKMLENLKKSKAEE